MDSHKRLLLANKAWVKDNIGRVVIDRDRLDWTFNQLEALLAATRFPLPDSPPVAGLLTDEVFASLFDVLTPGC